jgi:spectinomycin phosphotransferase
MTEDPLATMTRSAMNLDMSGIEQEELARFVDDAYALDIVAMSFLPLGEASYSYVAAERHGPRWLIKAQATARVVDLEARLRAVRFVQAVGGFTQVVAPRQNRWGECACPYGHYTVAVYPFVDGDTIEPGEQTDAYVDGFAALLGTFHLYGSRLPFPIPSETFDNPFEEPILRALRTVEAPGRLANPTQERLRALMLAQRSNLVTTLDMMRHYAAEARRLHFDPVLTHGDPNWANILVDRSGTFHLLDWEELALGPPERDLVFFSDRQPERFEAFLCQYLAAHGPVRLHPELFAFYQYRWFAQEIADYSTRILFHNVDPAEDDHAWAELQPYLPADHAGIAAGIHQIAELLARIATS